MNNKLITALRTAAKALEDGSFSFSWKSPDRCNCGVLACAILNKSAIEMTRIIQDMPKDKNGNYTWTHYAGTHCPITGIPNHDLFRSLFAAGLSQKDFTDLEFLKGKRILERMTLPTIQPKRKWWQLSAPTPVTEELDYTNARHVALYMRAWADLLMGEEEGAPVEESTLCSV